MNDAISLPVSIAAIISFRDRYCYFDLSSAFKKTSFSRLRKEEEEGIESKGRDLGRLPAMETSGSISGPGGSPINVWNLLVNITHNYQYKA